MNSDQRDTFFNNMNQMTEKFHESVAVKAFQVKLEMSKFNASRTNSIPPEVRGQQHLNKTQRFDSSENVIGEFDISGLPLPVKKHIITAGILQGEIFHYGDGFSRIKEVASSEGNTASSKTLHLQVLASTPKSYEMAISTIEALIQEALDVQKTFFKSVPTNRSWARVLTNEFEIQDLIKPVISHLITKGIIKGDIYEASGAVVFTKGSPYLANDSPQQCRSERPIYLQINGPDEKALHWAVYRIKQLIKEGEEIINNKMPHEINTPSAEPSNEPRPIVQPPKDAITPGVPIVEQQPQTDSANLIPPFMPQLGVSVDADVKRCVLQVQWLLAHPLLVSFMARPPEGFESKKFSKKMVLTALLSLPLYEQYNCNHLGPNKVCGACHTFFSNAQRDVRQCCESVVSAGYDISNLIAVDNYVRLLSDKPEQIGVLYDYPLPLNLFYVDNCRLFIDLVVNYGFEIEETHIESYLRSTTQWYPVEAVQKIMVYCQSNSRSSSKHLNTHQYPSYCSLDHLGGLINFKISTIGSALPGHLFPPDAPKIPRCKYFPFLKRLLVFSHLYHYNKRYTKVSGEQELTDSDSHLRYKITNETLQNPDQSSEQVSHAGQQLQPSGCSGNPSQVSSTQGLIPLPSQLWPQGELPPSFLTTRKPMVKKTTPNPSSQNPSRISRKQARQEKLEKIKEGKKEEVEKVLEKLKEKHGSNSFWTIDHNVEPEKTKEKLERMLISDTNYYNLQFGSAQSPLAAMQSGTSCTTPQSLQQVVSSMQTSMPVLQPRLCGARLPMLTIQEEDKSVPPGSSEQQNIFSDVISKLQEYIQSHATNTGDDTESGDSPTAAAQPPSEPAPQTSMTVTADQTTANVDSSEESIFSGIIQQLQQYIASNNNADSQTKSQIVEQPCESKDNVDRNAQRKEQYKNPVDPMQNEKLKGNHKSSEVQQQVQNKLEPSRQKRVLSQPTSASPQTKRVRIEISSTNPTSATKTSKQESKSVIPKQVFGKKGNPKPLLSVQNKRIHSSADFFSSVSVLGDSLLRKAREWFGGSCNRDIRNDWFTIEKLKRQVMSYHSTGGTLNPYCVVMVGANDIINTVQPNDFNQQLKALVNHLHCKGYYVYLLTLPLIVSTSQETNKLIPEINGLIMSYHTKQNLSVIMYHKVFKESPDQDSLLDSYLNRDDPKPVVLSGRSCSVVKDLIMDSYKSSGA